MSDIPKQRHFKPSEIAELLDLSEREVYRFIKKGDLEARKTNKRFYIRRVWLMRFIKEKNESSGGFFNFDIDIEIDEEELKQLEEKEKDVEEENHWKKYLVD